MYKKFLAMTMGAVVSLSTVGAAAFTSFAQETNQTTVIDAQNPVVDHSIEYTGDQSAVTVNDGTNGTINGDVTSTASTGDVVQVGLGQLTINGDVTGNNLSDWNAAVTVYDGTLTGTQAGQVTVNGYVETNAGAPVNVQGAGAKATINAQDDNEFAISGSNSSKVSSGGTFIVNGDVQRSGNSISHEAIHVDGSSNVTVNGDIYANNPIEIDMYNTPSQSGNIVINGTLQKPATITNGNGYIINAENVGIYISAYTDTNVSDIPDITVYEIANSGSLYARVFDRNTGSSDGNDALADQIQNSVKNAINYIIRNDTGKSLQFTGITPITSADNHTYITAKKDNPFEVAATVADGYTLSGGQNVTVEELGNGRYRMTLINNKGGITITSVVRYVPAPAITEEKKTENTPDPQPTVVVEETSAVVPQSAINVSNSAPGAPSGNPSFADVTKPSSTITLDTKKLTAMQYKDAVIRTIATAPQNGAMNIETSTVSCFDAKMIEKIASRPDIDVNVVFTYNGKKMKVVIPAGYNVKSLLDEKGYCGFLRLADLLGFAEI